MTVQTIVAQVKHDCKHKLGQFADENDYDVVIDSDTDFYIPSTSLDQTLNEQRVGFIFRKNRFTQEELIGAYEGLAEAANAISNNRGLASGPRPETGVGNREWITQQQYDIIEYMKKGKAALPGFDPIQDFLDKKYNDDETSRGSMWLLYSTQRDGFVWGEWLERVRKLTPEEQKKEAIFVEKTYMSLSTYAAPTNSSVVGTMGRYPRFPYVRHCAYNKAAIERFEKAFPYLQHLSRSFEEFLPERFANQKAACDSIDSWWSIPGTVFSTLTVNKSFRTACHLDAGDLATGFSNLSVLTDGKSDFTGGLLVLPEYRTAINLRPGDLLLVANHDIIHGNTEIDGHRISLVCYFREDLIGTGSKAYEDCRAEYVNWCRTQEKYSAGRHQYNGVRAGMFESQEWYDFLEERCGKEELIKMHPESQKESEVSTLW